MECNYPGQLSSPKRITCGVPQGSILGLLPFLLYINDMPDSLSHSTPSLFADDTEILVSSNDCCGFGTKLNSDLENIRKWMIQNKLQIHPNKTKHMFTGSSHNLKNKVCSNPILINNKQVPWIFMPRREHGWRDVPGWIHWISSKVSADIGAIRRIKPLYHCRLPKCYLML